MTWRQAPLVEPAWKSAPMAEEPPVEEPKTLSERAYAGLKSIGGLREAIPSAVGNIGTNIVAGVAGLGRGAVEATKYAFDPLNPNRTFQGAVDSTVDTIEGVQRAGNELFAPKTEMGQAGQELLGNVVEGAGKVAKYPLSAVPFAIGGSEERQEFMDVPIGDYLGELAQDSGASPLFATLAHIAPDVAMTAVGVRSAKAPKAPPKKPVPTIDELRAQSNALYKAVDDSGVMISDASVKTAFNDIVRMSESRGLRQKLTPKSYAALQEMAKDVRGGGLTLKKAEELRRVAKQAQSSIDAADAAMAGKIVKQWDNYIENLTNADIVGGVGADVAQYLKSARGLWSRARKTEQIEDLIQRAKDSAGQFSGSGYENALRTEFRNLAKNKKKMRMFTAAEQAAIRRVARGDLLDNVFRGLGKANPSGIVSGSLGSGFGFLIGGPTGAVAIPAIGYLSRKVATHRGIKNAERASEAMRAGK